MMSNATGLEFPRAEVVLGTGLEPARLSATASKAIVYTIPPPERLTKNLQISPPSDKGSEVSCGQPSNGKCPHLVKVKNIV